MVSRDEVIRTFDSLNVWFRDSQRPPHKPLLVLYALGQLCHGGPSTVAFRDVAPKLTELLQEFGPSRKSYHSEYPFWRLQNDGVWVIDHSDQLQRRTGQTDIPKRELLRQDVRGHFTSEIEDMLQKDSELVTEIASRLLHGNFAETLHQDILDAVGLDLRLTETAIRLRRDPEFRTCVLTAASASVLTSNGPSSCLQNKEFDCPQKGGASHRARFLATKASSLLSYTTRSRSLNAWA